MDKKSTYGLRLDQMASLFAMGIDEPHAAAHKSDDHMLRDLLHEQLTCAEPKGSLLRDTLAMMMHRANTRANLPRERPLGDILLQPHSDVKLLEAIKDSSKTLSVTLESQTETALARTLYFAAIAAALVHHDVKITQNSYAVLAEAVASLQAKPWMTAELAELFAQAQEICRRRSNET